MSLSNYSALSEGVLLGLFLWYFVKNAARDSWVFVELCVCVWSKALRGASCPSALGRCAVPLGRQFKRLHFVN